MSVGDKRIIKPISEPDYPMPDNRTVQFKDSKYICRAEIRTKSNCATKPGRLTQCSRKLESAGEKGPYNLQDN